MQTQAEDKEMSSTVGESDKWVIRGYKEGDIPNLVTLVNIVDEAYRLDWGTSESEMTHDFRGPRQEPERQIVVAEMGGRTGFVGYGRVGYDNNEEKGKRIYYLNVTVHPDAEGQGLEDELAARLIEIARGYEADPKPEGIGRATLKAYVNEQVHHIRRLWEGLGLKQVRYFQVMQRVLDEPIDEPAPVDGVFVRLYRRPEDNAAALEAFNNSFSDHYDHHDSPPEDWEHFTGLPTTRPDLSWLAQAHGLDGVEPGKIVGFCICAVFDEDNERKGVLEGWIDLLGTTRECRRKGLGRSILLHGLHSLRAAGLDTALLGVELGEPDRG